MKFEPAPKGESLYTDSSMKTMTTLWSLWFDKVVNFGLFRSGTSTTAGNTGLATLPAKPEGFVTISINGTDYKIPYYPV